MQKRPYPWTLGRVPPHLPRRLVVVCGTRTFEDEALFVREMDKFLYWKEVAELVIGGEGHPIRKGYYWSRTGADALANEYASCNWLIKHLIRPNWNKYGKSAGPRRNDAMARFVGVSHKPSLIAFWNGTSPGTKDMIKQFKRVNPRAVCHVVRVKCP